MKKVYGVIGLMEWIAVIKAGLTTIKVRFSGGYPSANGIIPAEFSTENPMIQHAIENSGYYKSGKIKFLRMYGSAVDEKYKPQHNIPKTCLPQDGTAPKAAEEPADEAPPAEEKETVELERLADAAALLNERFGIPTSRVKTKDIAKELGAANGVNIVWKTKS